MKQVVRVGIDFDGVIAYNPLRIMRPIIVAIKRNIFGVKKLKFIYPTASWQQFMWKVLHESSVFPAKGIPLLKQLARENIIEAHLVTGRYSFLDDNLMKWLIKHDLKTIFKSININKLDEQPHLFKEQTIKKLHLDAFIEDNWDIAHYLSKNKKLKVYWIYNILDRTIPYQRKSPFIEHALSTLMEEFKLKFE